MWTISYNTLCLNKQVFLFFPVRQPYFVLRSRGNVDWYADSYFSVLASFFLLSKLHISISNHVYCKIQTRIQDIKKIRKVKDVVDHIFWTTKSWGGCKCSPSGDWCPGHMSCDVPVYCFSVRFTWYTWIPYTLYLLLERLSGYDNKIVLNTEWSFIS